MSRAGYADFFPAAPSVLAEKAKAERIARWKANRAALEKQKVEQELQNSPPPTTPQSTVQHDEDRTDVVVEAGSATSTSTASSINGAGAAHATTLTPATSVCSPPAITHSPKKPPDLELSQAPAPAALLTPKATPPAAPAPVSSLPALAKQRPPKTRSMKITFDPTLNKEKIPELGKYPIYRYDGEGVCFYIFPSPRYTVWLSFAALRRYSSPLKRAHADKTMNRTTLRLKTPGRSSEVLVR